VWASDTTPTSRLLRRSPTVENRLEVALKEPPALGLVDRFGSVPKVVCVAITSSCKALGWDASMMSVTLTLLMKLAIPAGYAAAMVVLSKTMSYLRGNRLVFPSKP
jgi:hypothetical protein